MAQKVEHLPSKCKALSSNYSTANLNLSLCLSLARQGGTYLQS
jgi:hypothetical protein